MWHKGNWWCLVMVEECFACFLHQAHSWWRMARNFIDRKTGYPIFGLGFDQINYCYCFFFMRIGTKWLQAHRMGNHPKVRSLFTYSTGRATGWWVAHSNGLFCCPKGRLKRNGWKKVFVMCQDASRTRFGPNLYSENAPLPWHPPKLASILKAYIYSLKIIP